jgi:hypothetical protein
MTDTKESANELWKWTIDKVKKDNVVKKNPAEYDKWVKHILDIAQYEEDGDNGWFRENFLHISSSQIWELQTRKEDKINVDDDGKFDDISDEEEACAAEFLERLAKWWSHLEEPAEEDEE